MDIADSLAAFGTMAVLCLTIAGRLEIWHIYLVNAIVGCVMHFSSLHLRLPCSGWFRRKNWRWSVE